MLKPTMEAGDLLLGPKRSRGFTLIEVMTVVAIILVIAAITFPIFRSAKRSAFEASSRQALHQNWLALSLYRDDWGGGQDYGTVAQMALPIDSSGFKLPQVPPYRNPNAKSSGYFMYPKEEGIASPGLVDEWVRYSKRCWMDSIVLADFNFNDFDPWSGKVYEPKKGIGVLLGGTIKTRVQEGALNNPFWWDCKGVAE